ncbi:MAG: sugar ABC transporter ATP-binding protein [Janthinobacterium lividum]
MIDRRALLEIRRLTKRFADNVVLHGIDLTLHEGEILAVMGANGAGKSTLVQILSGALPPDGGSLIVDGAARQLSSPAIARAHGIVSVHQVIANTGVPSLSVAENLLFDALCGARVPFFTTPRSMAKRARRIALESGLDLDLSAPFASLGLAERQMVAIARALSGATRMLILDEPTASLSAAEAERLFAMLERLRARGLGILFISHRLADLERLADRIVVLRNGRIAGEYGRPLDLAAATLSMMGRTPRDAGSRERRVEAAPVSPTSHPVVVRLSGVRLGDAAETHRAHAGSRCGDDDVSGRRAARPITLDLHGGEVTVVTGSLGAGKSSLLEALFGLRRPAHGDIALTDCARYPASPSEAIDAGIFFVGEDRWRTSLADVNTLGADLAGTIALPHLRRWSGRFGLIDTPRQLREASAAIRRLGIVCRGPADALERLSGGNQQKVVLARWLARPSRLLLLDEPFQGVDLHARRDLIAALAALGPQTAVVIATNDMEEALAAADRLLVMRDRSIVADQRMGADTAERLLSRIAGLESASTGEPA